MPKIVSVPMLAHVQGDSTTLATLWRVARKDGLVFGFTDLDTDILYNCGLGTLNYLASTGITPSSIEATSDFAVDNMEMQGVIDSSTITDEDLLAGRWDLAEVRVYQVNYRDLSMGHIWLNRGYLGEVKTGRIAYQAELRGLTQSLQQQMSESVQPLCTATFCDAKCKKIESDYTIGGTVSGVISKQSFGSNLTAYAVNIFRNGLITWLTGANAGLTMDIKFFSGTPTSSTISNTYTITSGTVTVSVPSGQTFSRAYGVVDSTGRTYRLADSPSSAGDYTPTSGGVYSFNSADEGKVVTITYSTGSYTSTAAGQIDLQQEMPYNVADGDTFNAVFGCDKTVTMCGGTYNNIINFRGFPHLPGRDRLISGKSG